MDGFDWDSGREKNLRVLADQAATIAGGIRIKTEEGRILMTLYRRLVETLLDGKPTTEFPSGHHA